MSAQAALPRMLGIARLAAMYRAGETDPSAVVEEIIARREAARDPAIWITKVPDAVLREAAHRLAAAHVRGPLWGIPFAVKDNIDVAGMATTAACPAFSRIAQAHAPVVARLLDAGAVLVGKTNLDQFATGLVGTRSPYGAPRSVFSARHVSGGSSSGSAVAVAAGLAAFALGTDTAGSGRVPAAFNNLVGLKPTRGVLSTRGVVPACRSLDCVSILALDVADARRVFDVVAAYDEEDAQSRPLADFVLPRIGARLGVPHRESLHFDGDAEAARLFAETVERARSLGHAIVPFDPSPFLEAASLLYGASLVAERTEAVGDFIAANPDAVDPTVRAIIEGGRRFSAVDLFRDQHRLQRLRRHAARIATAFDAMLLPTTPTAVTFEEVAADPIGRNALLGTWTNFVNLFDLAAIAIPSGFRADGMPLGATLVGPAFSDRALAVLAEGLHLAAGGIAGAGPETPAATDSGDSPSLPADWITVAVAGAHLRGMPLNHELTALGARFRSETRTTPDYTLHALAGTEPPKPGLVRRSPGSGKSIVVEIWDLSPEAFGRFVAGIPAPLGIGKVALEDGIEVAGFICEAGALEGAADITAFGGWRAYVASLAASG